MSTFQLNKVQRPGLQRALFLFLFLLFLNRRKKNKIMRKMSQIRERKMA